MRAPWPASSSRTTTASTAKDSKRSQTPAGASTASKSWWSRPDREQSAASHALTLNRPLRMLKLRENEYIIDGTPADCVNLAILKLMKDNRPDLVVSGINFGPNLGDDVTYSGTVSAAFEGALLNSPSIAFSALVGENFSFERCAVVAEKLIRWALVSHRDPRIILNVNFPVEFTGVRVARLGSRIYSEGIIERRTRGAGPTTGSAAASRPGIPARAPTSKPCRKAASPSPRSTSISRITNRSRGSNRSRSSLATQRRDDRAEQDREFAHQRALMVQRHVADHGHQRRARAAGHARSAAASLRADARGREGVRRRSAADRRETDHLAAVHRRAHDRAARSHGQSEKVLEIGTGTGYQAVVLSKLCAKVFSIERVNELALRAVELIRTLKIYNASVKVFDGTYGWSDQAPFDRIIVAAAAPEVPEPLLQQLARTGKMVIPIGPEGNQRLARVMRVGTSTCRSRTAAPRSSCRWSASSAGKNESPLDPHRNGDRFRGARSSRRLPRADRAERSAGRRAPQIREKGNRGGPERSRATSAVEHHPAVSAYRRSSRGDSGPSITRGQRAAEATRRRRRAPKYDGGAGKAAHSAHATRGRNLESPAARPCGRAGTGQESSAEEGDSQTEEQTATALT